MKSSIGSITFMVPKKFAMVNMPLLNHSLLIGNENAMKLGKITHKQQVINEMRLSFYSERYKAEIKGKYAIFERKWNTISSYYKKKKKLKISLFTIRMSHIFVR